MTEPAAQQPWRVPRSTVDELFSPAIQAPDTDKVIGTVVSVEIDTCTVLVMDEEISGVVIQDRIPSVGDVVEIERRGDLWVLVDFLVDSFIEGGNSDAWHVVDDGAPALPDPEEIQVSGSMRDPADWTEDVSGTWTTQWDQASALLTQVSAGSTSLLSNEVFDVEPGQDITINATFTVVQGAPTVAVRLYLATVEESAVGPGDPDTAVYSSPALAYTLGETTEESFTLTVPDSISTTNGQNEGNSVLGRIEVYVEDQINADGIVRIEQVEVYRDDKTFPVGSVWFNPSKRAAPTAIWQDLGPSSFTAINAVTAAPIPDAKTMRVTFPDTGMFAVYGTIRVRNGTADNNNHQLYVRLNPEPVSGENSNFSTRQMPSARFYRDGTLGDRLEVNLFVMVLIQINEPGCVVDFIPEAWVNNSNQVGRCEVLSMEVQGTYTPGAVPQNSDQSTAEIRWWDGNSWTVREGAQAESFTTPIVKANSSAYVTRTKGSMSVSESLTLKAEISGSSGTPTGTVTWYSGPSTSGPWTKVGSKALSGGYAEMSWSPSSGGTYRFKGVYGGNSVYNGSEDVTNNDTVVSATKVEKTKTISASWQQAYNGSGGKVSGSNVDNHVQQGYYSGTHGNRKSLIGFNVSLPSDAEVTKVQLICSNWQHWYYGAGGTLVVGWHTRSSEPASWGVGSGATDRSRHGIDTGSFTVNITSWAANKVTRSDFEGITIGPGPSNSYEYYGYAASGAGPWDLKITYKTAQ